MTDGVITSHGTRTLTLGNLGYTGATNANYITNNNQLSNGSGYVTSSGNTVIGTDADIDTSGATIIDNLYMTDGVITSHGTRALTLGDLGYTGAADANNYSHPSYNGDDFSIDTGHLSGATVIDDIDINVTTDSSGHVTDCNGTVATRSLTLSDLGYSGATDANYSLIKQVVQGTKTDTASVTGGTFTDVGLSASITPSSSSSKILVLVQANISGSIGYSMKTRLMRGSTPINIGDAASNRPRATTEATGSYIDVSYYTAHSLSMTYLDSPGTTSQVTYKVQYMAYDSYVVYINRSGANLDTSGYDARTASSIVLMEVLS